MTQRMKGTKAGSVALILGVLGFAAQGPVGAEPLTPPQERGFSTLSQALGKIADGVKGDEGRAVVKLRDLEAFPDQAVAPGQDRRILTLLRDALKARGLTVVMPWDRGEFKVSLTLECRSELRHLVTTPEGAVWKRGHGRTEAVLLLLKAVLRDHLGEPRGVLGAEGIGVEDAVDVFGTTGTTRTHRPGLPAFGQHTARPSQVPHTAHDKGRARWEQTPGDPRARVAAGRVRGGLASVGILVGGSVQSARRAGRSFRSGSPTAASTKSRF